MQISSIDWSMNYDQFLNYLYSIGNNKYKDFSKKITPGEFEMIGIPIPTLKKIAKDIYSKTDYKKFLSYDSDIYEIIMLKGLVISNIKDTNEYKIYFHKFIQTINNWAVCDVFLMASKIINKDKDYYFNQSLDLIKEKQEFLNRVGFVILLDYFVTDEYIDTILNNIDGFRSEKYYANMALAWLISVCYIKYPDKTKKFFNTCNLDTSVIKMSIRKIKDSYRVSAEDKEYLKRIG